MGKLKRERRFLKRLAAERTNRIEHIRVAVPTIDGYMTSNLAEFTLALERASRESGSPVRFSTFFIGGLNPVEYARNVCVGDFLKSGADRLWFIDADMLPRASLAHLFQIDADIVAGRMLKFDHANDIKGSEAGIALCAMRYVEASGKFKPIVPNNGDLAVQDVDGVGTATMLIRRRVLEDKRMWLDGKYSGLLDKPGDCAVEGDGLRFAPPIFRTTRKPNGEGIMGEDLDFCQRAGKCGYSIKVHLGAECGHFKPVDLDQVMDLAAQTARRVEQALTEARNGNQSKASPLLETHPGAVAAPC